VKTYKEFINEAKHVLNYTNWGFVTADGEIIDALLDKRFSDPVIQNHEVLLGRLNNIYIDLKGKYGEAGNWYEWDSKKKKIGKEVPEIDWVDFFEEKDSKMIRWMIKRGELSMDTPNFKITKPMIQNMIKLLNYGPVQATTMVYIQYEHSENKELFKLIGQKDFEPTELRRILTRYANEMN
jgi:hypothetical protein